MQSTRIVTRIVSFFLILRNQYEPYCQQGQPTAADHALDGDVILAAQAALLIAAGHSVIIATTNVGHLARLVPADLWQQITA